MNYETDGWAAAESFMPIQPQKDIDMGKNNKSHAMRLLESARYFKRVSALMQGIRGKRVVIALPGEGKEDAEDRSIRDFGMVRVYLYAVIVELSIKAIWSFENQGQEPKHHHDVSALFRQLNKETRDRIKDLYIAVCSAYHNAVFAGMHQHGKDSMQVEMAMLEEALTWNKTAVKDYKYDFELDGRTVPCGAMWDGETVWFGAALPDFSHDLLDFAGKLTSADH
ncbi:MAG: HEPN domain-containing protein [Nitrospinae bacterium]|nr:HEPN domain-containing protein [Nitrospinota bacterium]